MNNLYYCLDCRRIEKDSAKCKFCESEKIKPLKLGAPVNIIGTKLKGRIFKIKVDKVNVIVKSEADEKLIKEYKPEELQKVL